MVELRRGITRNNYRDRQEKIGLVAHRSISCRICIADDLCSTRRYGTSCDGVVAHYIGFDFFRSVVHGTRYQKKARFGHTSGDTVVFAVWADARYDTCRKTHA